MDRSSTSDTPHDKFLDQFDWDGGDWLYRFKTTGAAYRVTDAEKDALVATFDRQQRWSFWLALPLLLAFVVWFLWSAPTAAPGSFLAEVRSFGPFFLGMLLGWGVRFAIDHFTFRAPLRALGQRTPVAPALPKKERRRLTLEQLPLTVLVGTATVSFLVLLFVALERPPMGPPGWTLVVASVAALAWVAIQGTRKYLLTRADYAANNLI